MSQPQRDSFRPKRTPARDLSTPQLRALRKELLMVRADVERAELLESYTQLREKVTHFSWLRFLVPSLGKSSGGPLASTLGSLLKQYPVLGSLLSLVIAKPLRSGALSAVRPAIKWIGIAFTAWETYRIWQRLREQTRQPRETAATHSTDTAGDSGG
jgi:hypothetical protein